MSTFTRVLLATDMSEQADKLTSCLFSLCPDTETEVVVAHAFDGDDDADPDGSNYKKILARLEGYRNDITQAGYEEVSITTATGETTETINKMAEERDADLVMVASHGKGFLQRAFEGSTTLELAEAAALPLFIYKNDKEEDNPKVGDLLGKVMIPTDFTKKSLEALNVVRSLREYVGSVLFVHVIENARNKLDYKEKYGSAMMFLKELVDEMKIFGIKADFRIAKGVASKKIISISQKESIGLILLAKNGADVHSGLELGSTSENVVLKGTCSMILLPAEDNDDD